MSREQIIDTIKTLSHSQGMYGRFLRDLYSMSVEDYDEVMTNLENQHFSDALDLVMYLEG